MIKYMYIVGRYIVSKLAEVRHRIGISTMKTSLRGRVNDFIESPCSAFLTSGMLFDVAMVLSIRREYSSISRWLENQSGSSSPSEICWVSVHGRRDTVGAPTGKDCRTHKGVHRRKPSRSYKKCECTMIEEVGTLGTFLYAPSIDRDDRGQPKSHLSLPPRPLSSSTLTTCRPMMIWCKHSCPRMENKRSTQLLD